jgi:hypothetical protein
MNDSPQVTRRRLLRNAGLAVAVVGASSALARAGTATPAAAAAAATKSGPITTAYVEVNNNSITNVGKYVLASNGANVFDIGIIFAANINYNGTSAYLYFNPQVQAVLDNAATQIAPNQGPAFRPRQPPGCRLRQLPRPADRDRVRGAAGQRRVHLRPRRHRLRR